jgi:hypothetical protein
MWHGRVPDKWNKVEREDRGEEYTEKTTGSTVEVGAERGAGRQRGRVKRKGKEGTYAVWA